MNARLTIMVTSPPDRDHLVVELWDGDVQWGEMSRSSEGLLLELYGHPTDAAHLLPLREIERTLREAANELRSHEMGASGDA